MDQLNFPTCFGKSYFCLIGGSWQEVHSGGSSETVTRVTSVGAKMDEELL
jgi:hypothetical protein